MYYSIIKFQPPNSQARFLAEPRVMLEVKNWIICDENTGIGAAALSLKYLPVQMHFS